MRTILMLCLVMFFSSILSAQTVYWYLVAERGDEYNTNDNTWEFADSSNYLYGSITDFIVKNSFDSDGNDSRIVKDHGNDTLVDIEVKLMLNNTISQWDTSHRTLFTYNTQGLLTLKQVDVFNNGTWEPSIKEEYTPNANNTDYDTEETYSWDSGQNAWLLQYKTTWVYNANYQPTESVFELYDHIGGSVSIDSMRREFQYNGNDQLAIQILSTKTNNVWSISTKDSLVYNANGLLAEQHLGNGSTFTERATYTYDLRGYRQGKDYDSYDPSSSTYTPVYNIQYSRDNNDNLILQTRKNWSTLLSAFQNRTQNRFYYKSDLDSSNIVGIDRAIDRLQLSVYPNPTTEKLTVDLTNEELVKYRLVDLSGRSVMVGVLLPANNVIDVAELPQGTYIMELSSGSRHLGARKILIE